jgi:hypothetical protein
MKQLAFLLPFLAAGPVLAHEIAAEHSHFGSAVLLHATPFVAVGAAVAALMVWMLMRLRRLGKDNRHDPR